MVNNSININNRNSNFSPKLIEHQKKKEHSIWCGKSSFLAWDRHNNVVW